MTTTALPLRLINIIIGKAPTKNKLLIHGLTFGLVAFAIFEYFSVINVNLPRIPVSWLLIAVIPLIQAILILKIVTVIRTPRNEDLLFILGLDFKQRQQLALSSFLSVHAMLRFFTITSMGTAMVLELIVFKVHSPWEVIVPPVILFAWLYCITGICVFLLKRSVFKPVRGDYQPSKGTGTTMFSAPIARIILSVGLLAGKLSPLPIRAQVLRNTLCMFRSEPLLFPLMIVTAPVLLVVMMLVVNNSGSPFIDFFSVIAFYAVTAWFSSLLSESNRTAAHNPDYQFERNQVLFAFVWTGSLFALPVVMVYLGMINSSLMSLTGNLRIITCLMVMALSACIAGTAVYNPFRKDTDQAGNILFLGGACIGLFISRAGIVFPVLVFIAFFLKEWHNLKVRNDTETISEMQ